MILTIWDSLLNLGRLHLVKSLHFTAAYQFYFLVIHNGAPIWSIHMGLEL